MTTIDQPDPVQRELLADAVSLVQKARARGYVLTVETTPCEPLAMGHYLPVVTVREAREIYRSPK
jgi:hypothetical protein